MSTTTTLAPFIYAFSRAHLRKFLFIGLLITVSRQGAMTFGLALDDYASISPSAASLFIDNNLRQGRPLISFLFFVFDKLSVDLSAIYTVVAPIHFFISSLLVLCIIDYLQLLNSKYSTIGALLIILHPYHSEIMTWREAQLKSTIASILFVAYLFILRYDRPNFIGSWTLATLLFFLISITYQVFVSYVITLTFLILLIYFHRCDSISTRTLPTQQLILLLSTSIVGFLCGFIFSLLLAKYYSISLESRAQLLTYDLATIRVQQLLNLLSREYFTGSSLLPLPIRHLTLIFLLGLVFTWLVSLRASLDVVTLFLARLVTLAFVLLSLPGIILLSYDWWPSGRVLTHTTLVSGVCFLLLIEESFWVDSLIARSALLGISAAIITSWIAINAQIFHDQHIINQHDLMLANRIVARLESLPGFSKTRRIYISGGNWRYESLPRTVFHDMNTSAKFQSWSKLNWLSLATGYTFEPPNKNLTQVGALYCASTLPWPSVTSLSIINDLLIVCLDEST